MGDATGRILLWRGVQAGLLARAASGNEVDGADEPAAEQLRARATVHWHAEPVCCMAFSPDDAYLLSGVSGITGVADLPWSCWSLAVSNVRTLAAAGGHEGVLVIWDLSNGKRTYLPRLGKSCGVSLHLSAQSTAATTSWQAPCRCIFQFVVCFLCRHMSAPHFALLCGPLVCGCQPVRQPGSHGEPAVCVTTCCTVVLCRRSARHVPLLGLEQLLYNDNVDCNAG